MCKNPFFGVNYNGVSALQYWVQNNLISRLSQKNNQVCHDYMVIYIMSEI